MNDWRNPESGLHKTSSRRWALNGIELTAGSRFEVKIDGHWIIIAIEHGRGGYYAIPPSVRLHEGLHARFIGEWAE